MKGLRNVVLLAIGAQAKFTLPQGMLGQWSGAPLTTVIGPWQSNVDFHVGRAGDGYFLGDLLHEIPGTWQKWLMKDDETVYCGYLESFGYPTPRTVQQPFRLHPQASSDPNTVVLCPDKTTHPVGKAGCKQCECMQWTLSLTDNDTLRSTMLMSDPVKHADIVFKRTGPEPAPVPFDFAAHGWPNNFQCNFSNPYPGSVQPPRKCPMLERKQPVGVRRLKDPPVKGCVIMNFVLDMHVSWQFISAQEVDVSFSAPATDDSTYVAFGLKDDQPSTNQYGMAGTHIIAGYSPVSGGCVRGMYAEEYVGAPTDMEKFPVDLSGAAVKRESGRVTVSVRLPVSWLVGGRTQSLWAVGKVTGSGCNATLQYHTVARGIMEDPVVLNGFGEHRAC